MRELISLYARFLEENAGKLGETRCQSFENARTSSLIFRLQYLEKEDFMLLAENYRNLSQKELMEKAHELGVAYEKNSGSCSQCTVAALREILDFEDILVKVASSSCGGQAGFSAGACGGVIGGTIVLDYYLGRPADMVSAVQMNPEGMAKLARGMEAAQILGKRFIQEYGSILCPGIQSKIFGRSFNLQDSADWKAFEEAGGHSDPSKCMSIVGNAVQWTLEILIEKGVVTL
jgi:C_GCAxxG_C_C family probable redox protein